MGLDLGRSIYTKLVILSLNRWGLVLRYCKWGANMIEKLDGTTGDYHPHRIGDKVNELIEELEELKSLTGKSFLAVFKELELRQSEEIKHD